MKEKKNWSAVSIVCAVQAAACALVLLAVLLWRLAGGSAYQAARGWYADNASNTILVYPAEEAPASSGAASDG